jgi:hypothetical protein
MNVIAEVKRSSPSKGNLAKTINPRLGHNFVNPLESLSIVAKPTSSIPAEITAIHAIFRLFPSLL